jgi:TolB-like protein
VDTFVDFEHGLNRAISKLREALGDSATNPKYIETVTRHGYRFIARTEMLQPSNVGRKLRLAVLPCNNLSGGTAEEIFSDGMTEEMIAQLGQLDPGRLGVIARTSAMQYKRSNKGIHQIGRELHVDYILEGSVRRAADRVRVTAQLVGVADQTHLWAESYDREVKDLLTIQSDIAGRVRRSLSRRLRSL